MSTVFSNTAASSPEILPVAALAAEPNNRLVSLDVYRGLTIAGMILVTDPGTYSAVYSQLRHAEWMGATATDMIFPSFLFISGVSITLSFASRLARGADRASLAWHLLRRSAILVLLGLAVNGFPDYDWPNLRLPGILQRIAICFLACGLMYLAATGKPASPQPARVSRPAVILAAIAAAILAVYWAVLQWVPVPGIGAGHLDTLNNLPAWIDRAILGTRHMWAWGLTPGIGVTYDPEGILSTLPAIATTLIGILAGEWMRTKSPGSRKASYMALAGVVLVLAGWLLSPLLPINKRIWTSTFALLSGGVSLLLFAALYAIVDLRRSRWWTAPVLILGTNAILAFVLSGVLTTLSDRIHMHASDGTVLTLHQWANQYVFAAYLTPINASLAYAITVVALNILLIEPLYHKRIFLRV